MTAADISVGAWPGSAADRRFALAMCLSLLIHGLVMFGWRNQPLLRQAIADGTLIVSFRAQSPAEVPRAEMRQAEPESPRRDEAEKPVVLSAPSSAMRVAPTANRQPSPVLASVPAQLDEPRHAAPPAPRQGEGVVPATPSRRARRPGEVAIIIIVDHDGRPGQIFWDRLPALTDEQFARLKLAVRSRVYGTAVAGTRLDEVINVFALLNASEPHRDSAGDGMNESR